MRFSSPPDSSARFRADCSSCVGVCCVALPFSASADFPVDKDAGTPCRHLDRGFRCGIHAELRSRGFIGCTVFDCLGAGQRASRLMSGRDWRSHPETAPLLFSAFAVLRRLHELLWYLDEVTRLPAASDVHAAARREFARIDALAESGAETLRALDVAEPRQRVDPLLLRTSALVRGGTPGRDLRGTDLIGASLREADLRGATLRGAYLIAADLRGADLRDADLIGADLRDTDLRGADLTGSFFVTQPQLSAALGDADTRVPARLAVPPHWEQP